MTEALEKTAKNEKGAMETKRKEVQEMLKILSSMCLTDLGSSLNRTKIETLVTIMVHSKDIT